MRYQSEVHIFLYCLVDEATVERIANVGLQPSYVSLCIKALQRILPELRRDAIAYDKTVQAAGFDITVDSLQIFPASLSKPEISTRIQVKLRIQHS
ncbi:hypothetical protein [Nitrosomonas sp. Nm166]|uniref:hypothetical protein n=1 Tax=Nitrosomonas sp. Nm166 TaxID=1881054 RepID=UPI0008EB59E6|nr:hypothetical protein [Nitrosomonas sp. Nm166]SFE63837.1 hypothetical protein SAMN05428977_102331 [Nitrosomonas sp. Nm166]